MRLAIHRIQNVRAENHCRTGIQVHGHAESFRHFLGGNAELLGFCRMERNAAIAARGNGNCQSDQLTGLRIKAIGFVACIATPRRVSGECAPNSFRRALTSAMVCSQLGILDMITTLLVDRYD